MSDEFLVSRLFLISSCVRMFTKKDYLGEIKCLFAIVY